VNSSTWAIYSTSRNFLPFLPLLSCPSHKRTFTLTNGTCLSARDYEILAFRARTHGADEIEVLLLTSSGNAWVERSDMTQSVLSSTPAWVDIEKEKHRSHTWQVNMQSVLVTLQVVPINMKMQHRSCAGPWAGKKLAQEALLGIETTQPSTDTTAAPWIPRCLTYRVHQSPVVKGSQRSLCQWSTRNRGDLTFHTPTYVCTTTKPQQSTNAITRIRRLASMCGTRAAWKCVSEMEVWGGRDRTLALKNIHKIPTSTMPLRSTESEWMIYTAIVNWSQLTASSGHQNRECKTCRG